MNAQLPARLLTLPLLLGGLSAQDDGAAGRRNAPTRAQKLSQVCQQMARLESLAFTTRHITTNRTTGIVIQGAGKFQGKSIESKGTWSRDLLAVQVGEADRYLFAGRRMVAADDDHDWVLRRARTAGGEELFFALDPGVLFAALGAMKLEVVHQEVGTVANRPVETYTIHLDGDQARTLLWSGGIPKDDGKTGGRQNGAGGAVAFQVFGGMVGNAAAQADVEVDLAISFDPATRLVHRVHGRSFVQGVGGSARGRVLVNRAGGGLKLQEREVEEEEEKAEPGTMQNGLPVPKKAKVEKSTVVEFTFEFSGHGKTPPPKLEPRAKALLGIDG